MAKKKRGQNNTPRRKRFNRRQRLNPARNWLPTYDGGNIAKAYRKHYSVDWPTAFRELAMLGVEIDPEYKEQVLESVRGQAEARKPLRQRGCSNTAKTRISRTLWATPTGVFPMA